MDIKDFILIGGGLLIALVVGHGFWIAWRARREPLRLDIVPDLIPDDVDEIERLRGELPNGGARVVHKKSEQDAPANLELDLAAPVLMDPADAREPAASPQSKFAHPKKLRPRVHQAPPRRPVETDPITAEDRTINDRTEANGAEGTTAAQVREVELDPAPIVAEPPPRKPVSGEARAGGKTRVKAEKREEQPALEPVAVEELLIINVLAQKGARFDGEGLVHALRSQGLRYGDMNIFHRVDAATKAKLYSVANAVEPGTFDLSDLALMRSPGMTFFLQLPGPDDAGGVFEDMLQAARNVALELGGELRDEDLSVLTGQTTEHMRQRIAEFARRRLSKRA